MDTTLALDANQTTLSLDAEATAGALLERIGLNHNEILIAE